MDRAAISDLRRGMDQSQGEAPLREIQRLLFALYFLRACLCPS